MAFKPTVLLPTALALAACSGGGGSESARAHGPASGSTAQAIVNGTPSEKAQDYVVQISIEKDAKMIRQCTGTLIAKNLVITARHCVGAVDEKDLAVESFEPSKLAIYTGIDAGPKLLDAEAEAHGARLFVNEKALVFPDIAIIMLDKELDLPVAPVRLDGGALTGEPLEIIGYGLTEDDAYPAARQQRTGLKVLKKGPGKSAQFELNEGEFQLGEAACAGDSGGPAISAKTGALVGIASRVSNGTERDTTTPASFCLGKNAEDVYTDLTPARAFIDAAFEAAGATPWIEGDDSPEEKAAAAKEAEETAAKEAAAKKAPAAVINDGCNAAPVPSKTDGTFAFFLAALALGSMRRRARGR